MAAFHGKRGTASFTGLTFEMTSFTVNGTAETSEASIMDSSAVAAGTHWKDYVVGFKDWTATVECVEPAAGGGIAALGTEDTLTLDTTAGLSYSGTAICTGIGVTNPMGTATLSLSFQGVAQLSAS